MKKNNEYFYFSLYDVLKLGNFDTKLFACSTIKNIIEGKFLEFISTQGYYYDGLHSNNLWQLIFAKFHEEIALKSKNEVPTDWELFNGLKEIFVKIQETYPKYDILLSKLSEENLDLFKPLKSTNIFDSTSRFNDTPQIASGYDTDSYATNYTQNHNGSITENEVNTIMGRIAEVDSNYKNVLEEWASSFYDIFIEELNINGI